MGRSLLMLAGVTIVCVPAFAGPTVAPEPKLGILTAVAASGAIVLIAEKN